MATESWIGKNFTFPAAHARIDLRHERDAADRATMSGPLRKPADHKAWIAGIAAAGRPRGKRRAVKALRRRHARRMTIVATDPARVKAGRKRGNLIITTITSCREALRANPALPAVIHDAAMTGQSCGLVGRMRRQERITGCRIGGP